MGLNTGFKAEMETWKLSGNFLEAILGAWKFRRNFLRRMETLTETVSFF
jgi:hypothetical protein